MPKLTVDLRINETLTIGDATIRLDRKSGQLARLVIEAPANTKIIPPKSGREDTAPCACSYGGADA